MTAASHDPRGGLLGTDQYQLTMAQAYWADGLADRRVQFDYFFRRYPDYGTHQAGYCVTAGLGPLLEWMESVRFTDGDLELLRSQQDSSGDRRFDEGFLDWLRANGDFASIRLDAVPEGRIVHANVPVATVTGPLAMAQLLETPLLNRLNYPTLVATKASRVDEAARGGPVLEFGMRRGPESGAHAGSRAALIGGCDFTSNVAASHLMGLDPKGTHAHSLVQVYMAQGQSELDAFRKFASVYPDDCVLLVDTVDILESGVPNAITVFKELEADGHAPAGIRLDSGDLAYFATESARLLDDAGFHDVPIVLSSDLDELVIWQILSQIEREAPRVDLDAARLVDRLVFGVGTRLITSEGDPSLGGVFKLVAVEDEQGDWSPAIKVSEDVEKVPIPGDKRVFRIYDPRGLATADVVALSDEGVPGGADLELFHPHRDVRRTLSGADISQVEELLEPVFDRGTTIGNPPDIDELRARRLQDLERLDEGVRRLVNPHVYHVSLTSQMKRLQRSLISEALASG